MEYLFEALWQQGVGRGAQSALADGRERVAWQDLLPLVDRICLGLAHEGLRAHRGVAILLECDIHWPLVFLAVLRGRGLAVPLSPALGRELLLEACRRSEPRILVYDARHEDLVAWLCARHEFRGIVRVGEGSAEGHASWESLAGTDAGGANFPTAELSAPAMHCHTADGAGQVHTDLCTWRNLMLSAQSSIRLFGFCEEDRHLALFPANTHPAEHFLRGLLSGGSCFFSGETSPRVLAELVERERISVLSGPSYLFRFLCAWIAAAGTDASSLRLVESRGPTSPYVARALQAAMNVEPAVTWEMRAAAGALLGPKNVAGMTRQNQPCPGCMASILASDGEPVVGEEVGELCFAGNLVMNETLTAPGEKEPLKDEDGRYRTGLMARHTLAGEIELLGGEAQRVERDGHAVLLRETEHCLEQHRQVVEAAVVSVRYSEERNIILALCVGDPAEKPDPGGLVRHCARRLHPSQVPDRVVLAERIPHTAAGLVDRERLARALEVRFRKQQS